jgi:hypothetical protein
MSKRSDEALFRANPPPRMRAEETVVGRPGLAAEARELHARLLAGRESEPHASRDEELEFDASQTVRMPALPTSDPSPASRTMILAAVPHALASLRPPGVTGHGAMEQPPLAATTAPAARSRASFAPGPATTGASFPPTAPGPPPPWASTTPTTTAPAVPARIHLHVSWAAALVAVVGFALVALVGFGTALRVTPSRAAGSATSPSATSPSAVATTAPPATEPAALVVTPALVDSTTRAPGPAPAPVGNGTFASAAVPPPPAAVTTLSKPRPRATKPGPRSVNPAVVGETDDEMVTRLARERLERAQSK